MSESEAPEQKTNPLAGFIAAAGVILAISYPVLALSTGVRAAYQLAEREPTNAPWLTLLAAVFYVVAGIGFAKMPRPERDPAESRPPRAWRRFLLGWYDRITPRQAWRLSLGVLTVETAFTLVIGTLSYVAPDLIGRNVWQYFGRDYGYFPLVQPLLGLAWLLHPQTLAAYDIRRAAKK